MTYQGTQRAIDDSSFRPPALGESGTPTISLLGISGSLRRASYSTAILRTLSTALSQEASLQIFHLNSIPLYNEDLDGEDKPPSVLALTSAISACDGLVVVSPEYNYGIPGVLKNAIDWASRPAHKSVLKDKPVVYMTSSPGVYGGVRAQSHLQQLFAATLSRPVTTSQVAIPTIASKVADGHLVDDASTAFALAAVRALVAEIRDLQLPSL
jgi:chromate reductase